MTTKLQRNPSTLKLMRNAATGKLMRTVAAAAALPCYWCGSEPTPLQIQVTFSGVIECPLVCRNWAKEYLNGVTINTTHVLTQSDFFVSPDPCGEFNDDNCAWIKVLEDGLRVDNYSNQFCSGEIVNTEYIDLYIILYNTAPYWHLDIMDNRWCDMRRRWYHDLGVNITGCIEGNSTNEFSSGQCYIATHYGYGGSAVIVT